MTAIGLCFAAGILSFWARQIGLAQGILTVMFFGYLYGILRANLVVEASHFIFDSALIGLYAAEWLRKVTAGQDLRERVLRHWIAALVALPAILVVLPVQDYLIQLVGLRGAIFFLPFLIIGVRINRQDLATVAVGLAVLNIGTFIVAVLEYVRGIEPFFPHSSVTDIIYRSNDVIGRGVYRIPSTFASSAGYGGTMVLSIAVMAAAISGSRLGRRGTVVCTIAIALSLGGVAMSASRSAAVMAMIPLAWLLYDNRKRPFAWIISAVVVTGLAAVIASQPRLQRFTTLADTEFVSTRITGTIKMSVVELVSRYPFGNGLGAGGTSLPYFLRGRVKDPIAVENEYARIALEEGILGLGIWIGFFIWLLVLPGWDRLNRPGIHPIFWICFASCLGGFVGSGLLTAVPGTALLFLMMGWLVPYPTPQSIMQTFYRPVLRPQQRRVG